MTKYQRQKDYRTRRNERYKAMEKALTKAVETLAASRHLIGKHAPEHHWLPEHDKRISELKAIIPALAKKGLGE